jgi:ATP-dependent Zn protease
MRARLDGGADKDTDDEYAQYPGLGDLAGAASGAVQHAPGAEPIGALQRDQLFPVHESGRERAGSAPSPFRGDTITGQTTGGATFRTTIPADANVTAALRSADVDITAQQPSEGGISPLGILINWFPMLLLIGVWIFFMRQMQGGGRGAMGFGKSKAKLLTEKTHGRVTFDDVAGIDEAKEELEEIVEFLKRPVEVSAAWAAKFPRAPC